jgi:hypothetical protein
MLPFTFSGLLGLLLGALAGGGAGWLLRNSGMSPADSVAWGVQLGALTCGLYGVLTDRPHTASFWPSYRALMQRHERVAVAAVPLAMYPMMMVGIGIIVWAILRTNGMWWATYIAASVATSLVTVLLFETRRPAVNYAVPTSGSDAVLPFPTPAALPATAPPEPAGPMSDEELAPYRKRGRLASVGMLVVGGAALAYIDYLVDHGDKIAMKLIAIAALGLSFGLGGLIEPLIMYRHKPEGKRFPRVVHLFFVLILVLMGVAAFGIISVYDLR